MFWEGEKKDDEKGRVCFETKERNQFTITSDQGRNDRGGPPLVTANRKETNKYHVPWVAAQRGRVSVARKRVTRELHVAPLSYDLTLDKFQGR